jgi:hypothetical protein
MHSYKTIGTALAVSGLALLALASPNLGIAPKGLVSAAFAQSTNGNGGTNGGNKPQGNQDNGNKGSQSGQDNQGGANAQGGTGTGQGGPGPDSDAKGPQAGAPSNAGSGGGKPVWGQEGIPEVELGRLSVARSPDQVLDRSFDEALASLTPEMISFYSLSYDDIIENLSLNWDGISFIDSPLQNLALLKDALDGTSVLVTDEGVTNDTDTLLAVFLGIASDKTVPISTETVIAVTTILGTPITGTDATDLAAEAEAIRIAVLAGHG